jgi:hypothetical protein
MKLSAAKLKIFSLHAGSAEKRLRPRCKNLWLAKKLQLLATIFLSDCMQCP